MALQNTENGLLNAEFGGFLMRAGFLDFTRNFKEFLAVHSFFVFFDFGLWYVIFWVFAHFLCLWRVAFSLIKRQRLGLPCALGFGLPFWHYLVVLRVAKNPLIKYGFFACGSE